MEFFRNLARLNFWEKELAKKGPRVELVLPMIKKVFESIGFGTVFVMLAGGLSSQISISPEDEQDEKNQRFHRTSATRPPMVISENEPRLELLRIGYDLEEVASFSHKKAQEEMQAVEVVREFQREAIANADRVSTATSGSVLILSGTSSGTTLPLSTQTFELSDGTIVIGSSPRSTLSSLANSISPDQLSRIIQIITPREDRNYIEDQFGRLYNDDVSAVTEPTTPPPIDTTPDIPDISELPNISGIPEELIFILFPELSPEATLDIFADASQLVNHLLTDATIGSGLLDGNRVFTRARLVANSFNYSIVEEIAARAGHDEIAQSIISALKDERLNAENQYSAPLSDVFSESLNTDLLGARKFGDVGDLFGLTTEDFMLFAAKDLTFEHGSVVDVSRREGDLGTIWPRSRVVVLGASDDVLIDGDVTFTNHGHEPMEEALAVGGGGDLVIQNSDVKHDGSNLGLGAGKRVLILKSSIETRDHLGIGSLGDLDIVDSVLRAGEGNRVLMYANDNLNATGLEFSDGLRQVYMDATTINLTDVDFPAGSEVRLVSQLGGLDGKYPNFGFSEPGRVNFIEDVSYGGQENRMMDRDSFDQFGQNISIESFNQ